MGSMVVRTRDTIDSFNRGKVFLGSISNSANQESLCTFVPSINRCQAPRLTGEQPLDNPCQQACFTAK